MGAHAALELSVSARDLSIEYRAVNARSRHLAVRGVSFDLRGGEVLGVIGESGSGKTTLAATIAGVTGSAAICGGTVRVLGEELRHLSARGRALLSTRVGYLPQDAASRLNSGLTVAENVTEPIYLRDRRFDARVAGQAAAMLIDAVRLPLSVLERRPYELSSGQRQRVALARSLILEPQLLVADEPIRGVDIGVRRDVLGAIPRLREERGFSAIVVSHELDVVAAIADRVAVLADGVIIGLGTLAEVVAMPEHRYLISLAERVREQGLLTKEHQ